MFENFIIYIDNYDELIECQQLLFNNNIKWKNDEFPEMYYPKTPVYLFIINDEITWTDDEYVVFQSSFPHVSYKEYSRMKGLVL